MVANSSSPWAGDAASRWGHWGSLGLTASVGAIIGIGLRPIPAGTPAAILLPFAILALALVSWLAMRRHDRRLCEVCAQAMPLNAAEVATRHRRRFAVAHAGSNKALVLSYLILLLGSNAVLLNGTSTERLGWALIQSSMIYLVLAYSSHRRFQPWCPQCRGGDGQREGSDDRAPLDSHSR